MDRGSMIRGLKLVIIGVAIMLTGLILPLTGIKIAFIGCAICIFGGFYCWRELGKNGVNLTNKKRTDNTGRSRY